MTNGRFVNPLLGAEPPQVIKDLMNELAAAPGAPPPRAPRHEALDACRAVLKNALTSSYSMYQAEQLSELGQPAFWTASASEREAMVERAEEYYIEWKMARDDEFWALLHESLPPD